MKLLNQHRAEPIPAGSTDEVIRAIGLSKTYPPDVHAVEDLNLTVHRGEIFGLLGPNGAGKSTTAGMLTTRVIPTAGRAVVAGIDVVAQPAEQIAHRGIVGELHGEGVERLGDRITRRVAHRRRRAAGILDHHALEQIIDFFGLERHLHRGIVRHLAGVLKVPHARREQHDLLERQRRLGGRHKSLPGGHERRGHDDTDDAMHGIAPGTEECGLLVADGHKDNAPRPTLLQTGWHRCVPNANRPSERRMVDCLTPSPSHPSSVVIRRPGDVIASDASAVAVTHRRPGEAFPPRPAVHDTTSSVMRWCVTVCAIVSRRLTAPQARPLSNSDRSMPRRAARVVPGNRGKSQSPSHQSPGPRCTTSTRPARRTTTAVS